MGRLSQCLDCEARKQSQLMWCHPAQLSRRCHTPGSKAGAEGLGGKFCALLGAGEFPLPGCGCRLRHCEADPGILV